jgi:hypothetical protein
MGFGGRYSNEFHETESCCHGEYATAGTQIGSRSKRPCTIRPIEDACSRAQRSKVPFGSW